MRLVTMGALAVVVAGCAGTERPSITTNYTPDHGGLWVENIKSTDMGTGPQQDILRITAAGGWPEYFSATGRSTTQGMIETAAGMLPAAMFPLGMALRRPDQTNVTNNNTTSGGSIAPGAAMATGVGVGRGGSGGSPVATATGGNPTATGGNPTATGGNPAATATGGNPSATGGNPIATGGNPSAMATGGNPTATATGGNPVANGGMATQTQTQCNNFAGPPCR